VQTGWLKTGSTAMTSANCQKTREKGRSPCVPAVPVSHPDPAGIHRGIHHPGPPGAESRPRTRRAAGPYLIRRGRIYYFRKRLPRVLAEKCSATFLRLSLQTPLRIEAMSRAARLVAACQIAETDIMTVLADQTLAPETITAILTETLRAELARILDEQDRGAARDDAEIDARIAGLEARRTTLRRRARNNDFAGLEPEILAAARVLQIAVTAPRPADLGRRAADLIRDILELEAEVLDGADARSGASELVARFSKASVDDFVARPILLSAAIAKTREMYPTKAMKGNIDAIAQLALAYFGDIPVGAISDDTQKAFFAWMARLPKSHGKRHGKNRYCRTAPKDPSRYDVTKQDEIDEADARDEALMQEIRALNHLSNTEKRALLADRLEPRLTMTTIRRNRDGLNRIFKAAASLGLKAVPTALSYRDIERQVAAQASDDPLYLRVTKPKLRMPWTEERLARFLTCPIYTGCFSEHRRSRPGEVIVRDSLYWVPLILLTIGSRIEEILLLKRSNLVLRNKTYCLAIGLDPNQKGKTPDAERIVPVPQLLLDLGFVDWIRSLPEDHGPLLFPDAARRSEIDDLTGPFSKALNRILDACGLGDFDEDFYAMRKTLSSMLRRAGIEESQRQAIAGHKIGTILNRHYTAHHSRDLKAAVDTAGFRLFITEDARRGHPVIVSCGLVGAASLSVEVVLVDDSEADEAA
jgi:integrase